MMIMSFCLLIVFTLTSAQTNLKKTTHHHIKWLTPKTQSPIRLNLTIDNNDHTYKRGDSILWDWIKWSQNKFVTHLSEFNEEFFLAEDEHETSLFILDNDRAKLKRELSTYEPVLVNHISQGHVEIISEHLNMPRNLFHLVYLNAHSILVDEHDEDEEEHVSIKCVADFYVGKFYKKIKNEKKFLAQIMSEMEKNAQFKLEGLSHNESLILKQTVRVHNNNEVRKKKSVLEQSLLHRINETQHYKIRLSVGPLVIRKTYSNMEILSCKLSLLSGNGSLSEYESTVHKVIEKMNKKTIEEEKMLLRSKKNPSQVEEQKEVVKEDGRRVNHLNEIISQQYHWSTIFYIVFACLFMAISCFISGILLRIVHLRYMKIELDEEGRNKV